MSDFDKTIDELIAALEATLQDTQGQPQPDTIQCRWPHGYAWLPLSRGKRMPRRLKKRLLATMLTTRWGSLRMDP